MKNAIQLIDITKSPLFDQQHHIEDPIKSQVVYEQLINQVKNFHTTITNDFDYPLFHYPIDLKTIIANIADHRQQPFKLGIFYYQQQNNPQIFLLNEQLIPSKSWSQFLIEIVGKIYQNYSNLNLNFKFHNEHFIIYHSQQPHMYYLELNCFDDQMLETDFDQTLINAIKPLQILNQCWSVDQPVWISQKDQTIINHWQNEQQPLTINHIINYLNLIKDQNQPEITYSTTTKNDLTIYQINYQNQTYYLDQDQLNQINDPKDLKSFGSDFFKKIYKTNPFML